MQMLFRSTDLRQRPSILEYLQAVGSQSCPFVQPARLQTVLFVSEYEFHSYSVEDLQAMVFYVGLIHAELLRKERRRQKTRIMHDLFCENAIFYLPSDVDVTGPELFDWPHWLLKLLYTRFSVLFGKFWQGEEDVSRDGRPIPIPPEHLLSIRSAIKPKDIRFFSLAPQLTDTYLQSCDDGTNVFGELSFDVPTQVLEAEKCDFAQATYDQFLHVLDDMLRTTFYPKLKKWGMEQWRQQKGT